MATYKLALIQIGQVEYSGEVEVEAATQHDAIERLKHMIDHEDFQIEEEGGVEEWLGTQRTQIGVHDDAGAFHCLYDSAA